MDFQGISFAMDFSELTGKAGTSASISLPESILGNIVNATQLGAFRIIHASFSDGNIFPSSTSEILGGIVIATSIVDYTIDNLQDPVVINFTKNEASLYSTLKFKFPSV